MTKCEKNKQNETIQHNNYGQINSISKKQNEKMLIIKCYSNSTKHNTTNLKQKHF